MAVPPPTEPQYDPAPTPSNPPQGDSSQSDGSGDAKPVLPYDTEVPDLAIDDKYPTSFPTPDSGTGQKAPDAHFVPGVPPVHVDLGSLRDAENTMISALRGGLSSYENLKEAVNAARATPQFWGPAPNTEPNAQTYSVGPSGGNTESGRTSDTDNNKLSRAGAEFKENIEPVQDQVLRAIGDGFETVGQYIAQINDAGSSYAKVDDGAAFPMPPS